MQLTTDAIDVIILVLQVLRPFSERNRDINFEN